MTSRENSQPQLFCEDDEGPRAHKLQHEIDSSFIRERQYFILIAKDYHIQLKYWINVFAGGREKNNL